MFETQLTVGDGNDCPNGMRISTIIWKLRDDWEDGALHASWRGVKADIVNGPGEERSGGVISVWSTSEPSAGDVTTLKTWCGTHTPDDGMDSTYTDLPQAQYVANGTTAYSYVGDAMLGVADSWWMNLLP